MVLASILCHIRLMTHAKSYVCSMVFALKAHNDHLEGSPQWFHAMPWWGARCHGRGFCGSRCLGCVLCVCVVVVCLRLCAWGCFFFGCACGCVLWLCVVAVCLWVCACLWVCVVVVCCGCVVVVWLGACCWGPAAGQRRDIIRVHEHADDITLVGVLPEVGDTCDLAGLLSHLQRDGCEDRLLEENLIREDPWRPEPFRCCWSTPTPHRFIGSLETTSSSGSGLDDRPSSVHPLESHLVRDRCWATC